MQNVRGICGLQTTIISSYCSVGSKLKQSKLMVICNPKSSLKEFDTLLINFSLLAKTDALRPLYGDLHIKLISIKFKRDNLKC